MLSAAAALGSEIAAGARQAAAVLTARRAFNHPLPRAVHPAAAVGRREARNTTGERMDAVDAQS